MNLSKREVVAMIRGLADRLNSVSDGLDRPLTIEDKSSIFSLLWVLSYIPPTFGLTDQEINMQCSIQDISNQRHSEKSFSDFICCVAPKIQKENDHV